MISESILYKIYNKSVHCTFSITMVYLKMLKKGLYIILLANFIISDAETWYTNPLYYAISSVTKRTTFREPISFSPFDIQMGIFNYGGADYWNQGIGSNKLGITPILSDSSNYEYNGLIGDNSRQCYLMDIDFLKYNLPNYIYKHNYIKDVCILILTIRTRRSGEVSAPVAVKGVLGNHQIHMSVPCVLYQPFHEKVF